MVAAAAAAAAGRRYNSLSIGVFIHITLWHTALLLSLSLSLYLSLCNPVGLYDVGPIQIHATIVVCTMYISVSCSHTIDYLAIQNDAM